MGTGADGTSAEAVELVNDEIRGLAANGLAAETWEFLCECGDPDCGRLVSLTPAEFDARRAASPPVRIVADRHVD
jgi:hypothetical protein